MRINRVFFDTHMGLAFQGLTKIAKDSKTPTQDTVICFLNRKNTAFKLMVGGAYITYYRSNTKIPLEAIQHLPETFGGSRMQFDQAVRKSLENKLGLTL